VVPLGEAHLTNPNFELHEGDFISEADVAEALVGCDICIHLVSTTLPKSSNTDAVFDVETNVAGTVRLLNHAVTAGVKKIIFLSSGGTVYGKPRYLPIDEAHPTDPICSYGITKLAIEKYLGLYQQLHGLDYTVLRPSNPFGERQRTQASQGAVAVFLSKVLRGEKIEIWGDGSAVRDYIYVADLVSAILAVMDYRGADRVFNIGSGRGFNLNEVLEGIELVTGRKADKIYTAGRAFDVPVSILDISKARTALKWSPETPFAVGLRKTIEWVTSTIADKA